MNYAQEEIVRHLRELVEKLLANSPRCHDIDHTLRVLENARRLVRFEGGDPFVVECAALLHDIGRLAEFADNGKTCHALIGAEKAGGVLRQAGLEDSGQIQHIVACIATHRYRNRGSAVPATIEARIIFDADKLDSMGAVGIGRAFHFAGRIGARVHNRREEALRGASYGSEDSAYREYLVKLCRLNDCLLTGEGRRLGCERHRFMQEFFTRLEAETAN